MKVTTAENVKKWKRTDVLKYMKSKQNELDLDDEDIRIIEKNKVAGQVFINLTEEKLLAPPYNLLGGPAGAIAFLIKSLKDGVQASASINELEKSEESFQEKLQTDEAIEKTCINKPSCNLISASEEIPVGAYSPETDYLQNTEATEKTCTNELPPYPISISNFLPETASDLLRYYDVWNRPHKEWPTLCEFSDHLYKVHNISKKDLVHSSFKIEIGILRKLFVKQHPAQSRLSELADQLKTSRIIKKVRRSKVTEKSAKQKVLKQKIELAKDSTILNGFHRINQHYNDYHEASSKLIKRNLSVNDDSHESNHKRVKR